MDHYLEITLLPDPESSALQLMSALFSKLHRALVASSTGNIGVSFPHLSAQHPGDMLRIHGERSALQWLCLPSIQLNSHSTGQRFRLFIRQTLCEAMTNNPTFSKYGLSQTSRVPWF
ncbi:type I-F CRISPR-associated endoribonuclease Cas6/Csy4 [Celerinatantimonas sp. MCCC 1A17872]|uniref:type I-F CRISPR-associated endoribonuclease Cas6/Csy4 n=1 Tax=Celerinatantimonas sp. MCCC 1A17872 TaxID=3177514 RepID=UPI0038C4F9F4